VNIFKAEEILPLLSKRGEVSSSAEHEGERRGESLIKNAALGRWPKKGENFQGGPLGPE